MSKDGTNRGGPRPGSGRKAKAVSEKLASGNPGGRKLSVIDFGDEAVNLDGAEMPPIKEYLRKKQKDGSVTCAEEIFKETWDIPAGETRKAVHEAWAEQQRAKADVRAEGGRILRWMQENRRKGILLAGRPYHVDPEIHHGIPDMIAGYGMAVLSEDSVPADFRPVRPLRVNDQWVYHSRMYTAAQFAAEREDLELIQLNSFGCGLDAVTTDQISEILGQSGKMYTVLKIDEVNNLGAARIRVRSLLSAVRTRDEQGGRTLQPVKPYERRTFTKDMRGYTILAPDMSPIHFDLLEPVFEKHGYHLVILKNEGRGAVDTGLRYVNNDACYPSIITIGQMMEAVLSGRYDTNRIALMMSQTGGCCRAATM